MGRLRAVRDMIRNSWWGLILAEHDTEPTELASAILTSLLGLFLLAPADTFAVGRIYSFLALLPETFWGVLLIVVGVLQGVMLRTGWRSARRAMAMAGFVIWSWFGISFLMGNSSNTGWVVYFLAAAGMGWVYVRLGMRVVSQ